MNKDKLEVGFTAYYPHDYGFKQICLLPPQAAVEWARIATPKAPAGLGFTFDEVGSYSCWLNKLFVIVDIQYNRILAIYKHDGVFSLVEKLR